MLKRKLALVAAVPLLWSSFALAQAPQMGSPETDQETAGGQKQRCTEHYAIKAAHLAYLEAKLELTDQQRDLWTKWRQTKLDAATQHRTRCLEPRTEKKRPTVVEREERMEKFLSTKLQLLQAERPALLALYNALTPEQKIIFDESHGRRGSWGRQRHEHREQHGERGRGGQQE
jgi:LTXXQ motif family protein